MTHIFTTRPHPTCKGKLLAVSPKPASWRCLTDTEAALYAIGGKPWTGAPMGDSVAFTLSPAQARDVDMILRAGYLSAVNGPAWMIEEEDKLFWHPDAPNDDLTRAEVLALISPPPRCTRTLEMAF